MTFGSWLFIGGTVGVWNGLTLWWTVIRMRPGAPRRAVAWAFWGAMLRLSLAAGLLIAALQQGIVPALLVFSGLWLARWAMACWLAFGREPSDLFGA